MKSLYLLITFICSSAGLYAQQNHFVYIQTENKQPFYVRMGDKVLSSSTSGYMVIPKLRDGDHDLFIGFPKNEWPQQRISIRVKNNDAGYVLKNFDAKGWGLFNLQTMEIIMPANGQVKEATVRPVQSDGFADVLADVVNNPAIKEKPPVKNAANTSEPEKQPVIEKVKESAVVKQVPEPEKEKVAEKPLVEGKIKQETVSTAVKLFSLLEADGRSMVYVDTDGDKTDTVRIFIPYKPEKTDAGKPETTPIKAPEKQEETGKQVEKISGEPVIKSKEQAVAKKDTQVSAETKGITENPVMAAENRQPVEAVAANVQKQVSMINSDCRSFATEDDFLKLRKKMAAQKSEENMVVIAKKSFVVKCYSTEQVRNLSALFLKDEGCYNFFDAAYPHVNDTQNFPSLISRLTDVYYINRFKAMIRQ